MIYDDEHKPIYYVDNNYCSESIGDILAVLFF